MSTDPVGLAKKRAKQIAKLGADALSIAYHLYGQDGTGEAFAETRDKDGARTDPIRNDILVPMRELERMEVVCASKNSDELQYLPMLNEQELEQLYEIYHEICGEDDDEIKKTTPPI